jgi:hypothetical protein
MVEYQPGETEWSISPWTTPYSCTGLIIGATARLAKRRRK